MYFGSKDLLETLGVKLIAGRDFNPDEYVLFDDQKAKIPSVIVTRGIADRLYPGQNAVGKKLYASGNEPQIIVGVVERLARPNELNGIGTVDYAMILPTIPTYAGGGSHYLLRVDPARRAEVLAAVDAVLDKNDASRIVLKRQTFDELRREFFRGDRSMAYLLTSVSIALLIITALGVVGLASFWVQQRAPDRHPAGARRDPRRHPALLPDRELHPRHARHRARHGPRLRDQPMADEGV